MLNRTLLLRVFGLSHIWVSNKPLLSLTEKCLCGPSFYYTYSWSLLLSLCACICTWVLTCRALMHSMPRPDDLCRRLLPGSLISQGPCPLSKLKLYHFCTHFAILCFYENAALLEMTCLDQHEFVRFGLCLISSSVDCHDCYVLCYFWKKLMSPRLHLFW